MRTQHTPEPWTLKPCKYANDTAHIIGGDGKNVSFVDCEYYNNIGMEDNKRIVDCVNDLAGKPKGYVKKLEQQRDDLLAALNNYAAHNTGCDWYGYGTNLPHDGGECSCGLIEAIAKAVG